MSAPSAPNIYIRPRALIDSVFLYWRPPTSDGGSPITNYTVTCPEASYSQSFSPTVGRITVSSLTSGIDYTFQITATNAVGTGPAATYRTVQVGEKPDGAVDVSASTLSNTSAVVNWSFSTNTGEAPTKWFVLSAIPSTIGAAPIIRRSAYGSDRQREVNNLTQGITYRILVQAVNDVGYAPPTALSNYITTGSTPTFNFSPDELPGLLFWGDMSQLTGPTVSEIPNLGNFNDPAVTLTGTGTVTQAALNGKNVLTLNNSQNFTGSALSLPNWTLFTVARKNTEEGYIFTDGENNAYGYMSSSRACFNLQLENVSIQPNTIPPAIPNSTATWDIQTLTKWNDINGLNVKFNWNGSTLLQGTSALYTNKDTLLTNISINTQSVYTSNCDVAEILIFESSLSQEEIQTVEGYLAHKWGLQANLPSNHPYKILAPESTTPIFWNPTRLSGCQLWLDAADVSTIQKTDSTITQWNDKSGNSNDAVATGSPQYSNQTVQFAGAQYFSSGYTAGSATETAFVVINFNNLVGEQDVISWNSNLGLGRGREYMLLNNNMSLLNSSQVLAENGGTPIAGVTAILSYNFSSSFCNFFTNGSITAENLGNYSNSATGPTIIGSYGPTGGFLNANISEIVIYNRILTQEERQVTEGYLAWKWGLQGD
jgi:hypothetical protein